MKTVRIINAAFWAVVAIALCIAVTLEEYVIDKTIQGK